MMVSNDNIIFNVIIIKNKTMKLNRKLFIHFFNVYVNYVFFL